MKVNDIYLAFLSAFDSTDKDFGSFFSDFQSYSASLHTDIERSLIEIAHLTGSVLPTYENISAAQYYAEYGSHQVQLRINGSGINKLFGGDITTGIVSVSSITVDYPSEAVHLSVSGSGIFTNLDTGAISGSFNSFQFTTPWINVIASGSISVAGSSVTSPLDVFGHLQNLSISYPKDSVLLSLVGEINYYQDALGKINYSGDVTEISLGNDKADLTIKGDLSCTFDEKNGLNLSGNNLTTGIISVSSIAVNYPSQSLHLAFSGLGSGISANLDTGAISGTFHSFHFTTPWLDVIASGSISVAGSSVLSSLNVVGALDALSITYPDEKFLLSILGDINYTQDASGQFHYDGGATDIRISKNGADLAIKGDISCAFDEQHGLGLSGSVHEIDVQLGDVLIECIGDIRFGAKGVESADIQDLSILVNGNYYDASTLNLKDLLVDWVGNDMIFVDQNGDWCINDAKFPLFSDTINYLLEKINPTPPTVLTFSPSDAATGVAVGHDIVLTFSEAIQAGTGAIEIHSGSPNGALVEHYDASTSHNLTIVDNTLTINPNNDLANATHYFVTFSVGSVKDYAGNVYAGTTAYDFTTVGAVPHNSSTFLSGGGVVTTDFGGSDFGRSIVLQTDGKIIVAGESSGGGDGGFAVVRYNVDGSLDTTFDGDGKVTTDFGGLEYATSAALQSDGKIVVAGYNGISSSGGGDFAVVRYNTNGSLDTTFDGDGKVITDLGGWDKAESVKIESDGKIVVAGYTGISSSGGGDFAVVRYNSNGTLDTSFGANGKVITNVGAEDYVHSLIVQTDNKIVVIGESGISSSGGSDFALVRYNADGSLDTTFGVGGKATTDFRFGDFVGGAAIQPDGKIVVVGDSYSFADMAASGGQDFVIVRYNSNGTLDTSFDSDGKIVADFGGSDSAHSVTLQPDGKIVVTGSSSPAGGSGSGEVIVVRYNTDGTLDTTFSGDGVVKTALGDESEGNSLVVQSDGRILVAGASASNGNPDFLLVRYNADGSMAPGIDFDGTPVGMPGKYEGFADFFLDPTKLTVPGYLASFVINSDTNGTAYMSDVNSDGIPDSFSENWTNPSDSALMTSSGTITWYAADIFVVHVTAGATTSSYDHWGRIAYDVQGKVVGMYALNLNPVFTLTPDTTTGDALIATFTIPEKPGTWSLFDSDLNGVVDRMTRVQTYTDEHNVQQKNTNTYSLTWSDSTHWAARATAVDLGVGPIFDVHGRPTTIPFYTHTTTGPDVLHEISIIWQTKGADNVVATFDLPNALSGKLLDTNGDSLPDQAIFTSLSLTSSIEGGPLYTTVVNFTDWSNLNSTNTHLSAELQTTTDPSLMFTGTIKGASINPTTLAMPSYFMGSSSNNGTDTTNPTVTTFSPADGATGVAVGRDIVLTFSEAIQKGAGTIAIHSGSMGTVVESYDAATSSSIAISGNTLTINPTADLSGGKHYYVTFADGSIKDIAGNNFAGTSIYDFTTDNISTIALTPTKNPLNSFYISASQGGTLYDTNSDGVIDHVRVWGLGTSTGYYKMEWSDATHWTAKGLFTYTFGTEYDIQGRPKTCIIYGAELPINWASAGNSEHLLATISRVNGTLSETWKVFDNNSDNQADAGIYTATTDGVATTTITTSVVALTQDSYGRPTSVLSEIQTSSNPRDVFSGTVTGSSSHATAIQLPLGGSGAYTLMAAGTLVDSFTIYPSFIGRLYDMDGNSVIDQMDLVSTTADQSGQSTTNIYSFALTWSDRTHWTANAEYQMVFGTTFDADQRPMTWVTDGFVHDIVWQNKGADNIVATSSFAGKNSGELVVVTFIDSLGDSNPDELIYVKSNGSTVIERFQANIVGWTNNPTAVTLVIQTATNPAAVFTGSVTGSNIHAQDILEPLFPGNSGGGSTLSSHKLISTKHQVDVFNISATDIGRLYDMDSNGIIDRMDVARTSTGQSGQTSTSIKSYALSWNDTAHWTAHAAYELLFGLQYDGQGRPTTIFMNGAEQTINWATTVTNGVLATVPSVYDGIAATLTLLDTNADSKPDAFDYTEGSGSTLQTAHGTLDWWVKDSSNHSVAVSLVTQTSSKLADSFSGSVTGSSSNPTAIILPTFDTIAPTVTTFSPVDGATGVSVGSNIVLEFSEVIQKGSGAIEIRSDSPVGTVVASYNVATSSNITIAGNALTINPSADLANGTHYFVTFSDGSVKDLAGNSYAGTTSYDFMTGSNGGIITTDFGGNDGGFGVTLQSDGKILVAGSGMNGSNVEFHLARYNSDGTLDTSFSGDGKLLTDFGGNGAVALSVVVQSDHKILVSGQMPNEAGGYTLALARYNPDGSFDTTFGGGDGQVTGPVCSVQVALQSDGKILIAAGTTDYIALARYNADGSVDTTFGGGDGMVTVNPGQWGTGESVVVQSDGKILVAGYGQKSGYGFNTDFVLLHFTADGTLDTSFGSNGIITTDFGNGEDRAHSMVQSDGKILVAGSSLNETNNNFAVARYNMDGTLDPSFSGDGKLTTELGGNDEGYCMAVQSNGKILVAGHSNTSIAVVRYNTDGSLDSTFSSDGIVTTDIGAVAVFNDHIFTGMGMTLQPDGRILVTGQSNGDMALVRYNSDGTLDASFDGGSDTTSPALLSCTPADGAFGVAVGSDIKLSFNENIHFGSGTISIHVGSASGTVVESYNVATSTNVTVADKTLTINPTADLVHGTHYFVTFENGTIKDLAGNNSSGTNTYDFTTDALPLHQDLTGSATFWKTGAPITGVASTLTTAQGVAGAHPVEFKNIQLAPDGTRTLELWETSASPVQSAQLEFTLSSGSVATWQDAAGLTPGWISLANTGISGQFILGSIGTTALSAGPVKLGTLTLTAPTNPQHFELLLTTGQLNNATIPTFGIASDSMTTGSEGLYEHINMPDGTYALTSAKVSGTAEADAVHANDALAALKMAVGMNPNTDGSAVSPYQFLAADVNKDGVIRAADALNILKMAVKLDTAPANEWLFVPESVGSESMSRTHVIWPDNPLPVTLDVDQQLHLIGIVKGDVDGSWVA